MTVFDFCDYDIVDTTFVEVVCRQSADFVFHLYVEKISGSGNAYRSVCTELFGCDRDMRRLAVVEHDDVFRVDCFL